MPSEDKGDEENRQHGISVLEGHFTLAAGAVCEVMLDWAAAEVAQHLSLSTFDVCACHRAYVNCTTGAPIPSNFYTRYALFT